MDLLERCAQYLLNNEKIEGVDFYKLMNNEIDVHGNPVELNKDEPVESEATEEKSEDSEDKSENED